MRMRALTLAAVLAVLAVPPAAGAAAKPRLPAFDSCAALVSYARAHAPRSPVVMPVAEGAPDQTTTSAPTEGATKETPPASGTNIQEAGVDEPDLVKTDGRTLFAVAGGAVQAVDVREGAPRLIGTLPLDAGVQELLLRGDRLLAIGTVYRDIAAPEQRAPEIMAPVRPRVALVEVDVSDPADMRVVRTLEVDGRYVSARLTGATARVVLASTPRALERARPVAARSSADWVPRATLRTAATGKISTSKLVDCRDVRRPPVFSGLGTLTVLTIDLDRGLPAVDEDAVLTDASTVYASPRSLYVATERWLDPSTPVADVPQGRQTTVSRFDTATPNETTYRSSGSVRGYLLNQFSLSESEAGDLRVATTEDPRFLADATEEGGESFVTVLRERDGALGRVGGVGGLGRGERIQAVRFIGDLGYVVTFRRTDPLYVVDLRDPAAPRVAGELKIPGYSAYLHPIGDGRLLGIGQDASSDGRVTGAQVSLFDVSDPARPARLAQRSLGARSSSEVEYDHHAFLWWAPTRLAVLPVSRYGDGPPDVSAVALRVGADGLDEVGRVRHQTDTGDASVRREVVVGERLLTVSDAGVLASALGDLARIGWAAFPQPAQPPGGQPLPIDGTPATAASSSPRTRSTSPSRPRR